MMMGSAGADGVLGSGAAAEAAGLAAAHRGPQHELLAPARRGEQLFLDVVTGALQLRVEGALVAREHGHGRGALDL